MDAYTFNEKGEMVAKESGIAAIVTQQHILHCYSGMQFVLGKNEDGTQAYMVEFDIPTGAGVVERYTIILNEDTLRRLENAFRSFNESIAALDHEGVQGPQGATAPTSLTNQ